MLNVLGRVCCWGSIRCTHVSGVDVWHNACHVLYPRSSVRTILKRCFRWELRCDSSPLSALQDTKGFSGSLSVSAAIEKKDITSTVLASSSVVDRCGIETNGRCDKFLLVFVWSPSCSFVVTRVDCWRWLLFSVLRTDVTSWPCSYFQVIEPVISVCWFTTACSRQDPRATWTSISFYASLSICSCVLTLYFCFRGDVGMSTGSCPRRVRNASWNTVGRRASLRGTQLKTSVRRLFVRSARISR